MFNLKNKVIVITGGAGLLGRQHAEAVAEFGANPVILDLFKDKAEAVASDISKKYKVSAFGTGLDITDEKAVEKCCKLILKKYGRIDVLINNAANNPKMETKGTKNFSRLENFDLKIWEQDIAVGLTGAFLCSKYFGHAISENSDGGSIINISSDLGIIGPDQRLYRKEGLPENEQPVKPVTYSVVKTGLVGLTRYISTYWADKNVRCNALCPGGVYNNQPDDFVKKLTKLIPLGRMAKLGEYKGMIVFLCSDAASYMNGSIISMDGGRTAW